MGQPDFHGIGIELFELFECMFSSIYGIITINANYSSCYIIQFIINCPIGTMLKYQSNIRVY